MSANRRLRVRLEIEGSPVVFVSDARDAGGMSDGRTAVAGLLLDGLALEADLDPVAQELDIGVVRPRILPNRGGSLVESLLKLPEIETYVTQDAAASDTRIYIESNSGFTVGSYAHVGLEVVKITAVGSDATGDYLDVLRGQWNTEALAYYAATAARPGRSVPVSDRPLSFTGRRAELYVLDAGGWSLEWRGVVLDGWRFDGETYTITIDGITAALDASVAPSADASGRCANVNAPATPLPAPSKVRIGDASPLVSVRSATDLWSASWWRVKFGATVGDVRVRGWFSDWSWFASSLQTELNAIAPADHTFEVAASVDGALSVSYTIDPAATTPQVIYLALPFGDWIRPEKAGVPVTTAVAGETYTYAAPVGSVVRFSDPGFLGANACGFHVERGGDVRDMVGAGEGESTIVKLPFAVPSGTFALRYRGPAYVVTEDGGEAHVSIKRADVLLRCSNFSTYEASVIEVVRHNVSVDKPAVVWLADGYLEPGSEGEWQVSAYVSSGFLGYQIQQLVSLTTDGGSDGTVPRLYAGDFESLPADALAIDDSDAESPLFGRTRIAALDSGTTVSKWLSHELRARNWWLCVDAQGRLRFRDGRPVAETDATSETLDASVVTVDEAWPIAEQEPFGRYTRVDWRDGYDLSADRFSVRMTIVDYAGAATTGRDRAIEIALHSAPLDATRYASDLDVRAAIIDAATDLLAIWSQPYSVIEVVTGWPVKLGIGDVVRIDLRHLPDVETGARGLKRLGRVIGFRRDLDRASCRYRVLVSGRRIYGYTPAVRVTGATLVSGTEYDLAVATTTSAGTQLNRSTDVAALFPVGSRVRSAELGGVSWYAGTVTAVSGSTIRVLFDSAPTFGTGETFLVYHDATEVSVEQEPYVYVADTAGQILFGSGAVRARRFQP